MITACSPMVGQFFDTMIEASSDKEWLFNGFKLHSNISLSLGPKKYDKKLENQLVKCSV